jgi:nitrile hydratase accessory protein
MDRPAESLDNLRGASAPPRKNGELVFDAPWESRAFGMALALHAEGAYPWNEFSSQLAAHIQEADTGAQTAPVLPSPPDTEVAYYAHWLAALETLVLEKGLLSHDELDRRTAEMHAGMWDDH